MNKIGRYQIHGQLGGGGMAVVYRAYDPPFRREVAIKVMASHFLHDPQFRQRFQREAQVIAALQHPAIVPVYDFGEQNGQPYLVMALMQGGSLADRLQGRTMSLAEASYFLERIAPALDLAHQTGIVHRDLKPDNILFDQQDNPYLADFGIAKLIQETSMRLSQTGLVIGTPFYMSPEQARGEKNIDGQSDIYSLGAILFEMLTGQRPYDADTPAGFIYKHIHEPVPNIRAIQPNLPLGAETVIEKAMAKNREERYATASEMAAALKAITEGKASTVPTRSWARQWALWGSVVALLVVVLTTMMLIMSGGGGTDEPKATTGSDGETNTPESVAVAPTSTEEFISPTPMSTKTAVPTETETAISTEPETAVPTEPEVPVAPTSTHTPVPPTAAAPSEAAGESPPASTTPIDEVEPNESAETGQELATIGAANPINGAVNSAGDIDWFSFSAEPGKSYVVELFHVDLSLATEGGNCNGYNYSGIGLKIYSPSLSEVKTQCKPSGAGNVQTTVQFRPETSGRHHIQLIANADNAVGHYSLRVLPEYSDANAWWDESNFEPNNQAYQALEMTLGAANALTSRIEARDGSYHTNFADVDWYRFNAQAGQSYVLELFNVDISLTTEGENCNGYSYQGVGLKVYNPSVSEEVATECEPSGSQNVQSIVQFRTESSGWYHIQVIPNANNVVGRYSIRILPKYDDPNASWDESTFEPNNQAPQAVEITPNQAFASTIGTRDGNYVTNFVDVDWYRFEAVGGQSYLVELFNVDSTLTDPEGENCYGYNQRGIGIQVYDSTVIGNPKQEPLAEECVPNGSGEVHNRLQFQAETTGTYHIWLIPNSNSAFGNYEIRVLSE